MCFSNIDITPLQWEEDESTQSVFLKQKGILVKTVIVLCTDKKSREMFVLLVIAKYEICRYFIHLNNCV